MLQGRLERAGPTAAHPRRCRREARSVAARRNAQQDLVQHPCRDWILSAKPLETRQLDLIARLAPYPRPLHPDPCSSKGQLARIEAVLRRRRASGAAPSGAFVFGDVRVEFGHSEVQRGGEPVAFSSLEFKLLRYFIEHRGDLVSRRTRLEKLWGYPSVLQTRTVDVHVAPLRHKLERHPAEPEHITTVRRMGYRSVGW